MRHARPKSTILETDILVLGAGLAGLRAALAAKEFAPALRVTLVSPRARPSGSSFANRNNALGMQAPTPDQAETFVAEVLRLGAPGAVRPQLVQALAQDAPACLYFLLGLGLGFRREASGTLQLFPGCFSTAPRAVVFDGLAQAHAAFLDRTQHLGVEVIHGFEALELTQKKPGARVIGAHLCTLRKTGGVRQTLAVRAQSVVAALGGPAPLFARRICGPGGSGLAYGLLASAGARLANTEFLQWFWVEAKSLAFVNPGELVWPQRLAHLAHARLAHCPMANGPQLADVALDLDLLARLGSGGAGAGGVVRAQHRERGPLDLVLAAHAGNGGALIDLQGRTSVPGLFACGECATGMHGANRLGGGMVLSALAFGARAGRAAAQEAIQEATGLEHGGRKDSTAPDKDLLGPDEFAAGPNLDGSGRETARMLRWIRPGMQRFGPPEAVKDAARRQARQNFVARLRGIAAETRPDAGQRMRLLARSALAVLDPEEPA